MQKFTQYRLSNRSKGMWIWSDEEEKYAFHPLLALVLVMFICQGCAVGVLGKTSAEEVEPGAVLFSDDFSDPPSGWGTWNRDGAVVEYSEGGLRIQVQEPQYDFWSVAGQNFSDTHIEVDATYIGGPQDNDFGVICRYVNKDNFYMLVVSSDGYYGIAKMKNGQHSMIGTEQLQYSGMLLNNQDSYHLSIECIGSSLSLSANGQKLIEAQDTDFTSGDVGLLVGAYNHPGVDILFDNFVVKMPAD